MATLIACVAAFFLQASASWAEVTLADFDNQGFDYLFSKRSADQADVFQQTIGRHSTRLFNPISCAGGACVRLHGAPIDLSSYKQGRIAVQFTKQKLNRANQFVIELLDDANRTGKWHFDLQGVTAGKRQLVTSQTRLAHPESGIGDYKSLDLSRIIKIQVLGDYRAEGPFDVRFSKLLVDNHLDPPIYEGYEPDAAWRAAAAKRIDKVRKADLHIYLTNAAGKPLPGGQVKVSQQSHAFGFGSAVVASRLCGNAPEHETYKRKVAELFNIATLENSLKWPFYEGEAGAWWTPAGASAALDWLAKNGLQVRGHALVWPGVENLPADLRLMLQSPPLTSNQQQKVRNRISKHFTTILSATNGKLAYWDVVNEPYTNDDLQEQLEEGDLALVDWFRQAAAQSDAALFINDFGVLASGGGLFTMQQNEYYKTIQFLQSQDAPIGGIGFQSHFDESSLTGPEKIWVILDRFAKLGLKMQVTEFDFATANEQLQADYTRDFMTAIFAHEAVDDFVLWGFWQAAVYRQGTELFRKDWSAKPNGQVFLDLVYDQWWTQEQATTDNQGMATVRGFKGDYTITVSYGEATTSVQATLTADGQELRVKLPGVAGVDNGGTRLNAAE